MCSHRLSSSNNVTVALFTRPANRFFPAKKKEKWVLGDVGAKHNENKKQKNPKVNKNVKENKNILTV